MDTKYNPEQIEQPLYEHWEQRGYFKPNGDLKQPSYCIMIPPPNVTGSLHMGHAFQQTLMDILIRYHRMQGDNTLWQVGTDHSGIAAQMVVERKIEAEEGKTRHDYGRDAFLDKVWQWKEHSGGTITQQMRRLGASVDWDRERFTMDEGLSLAVKEVFIRLYREGLIYRGKRLVNWDCKLQTAISDLEVENRETKGSMWYLRYPLANGLTTAEGHNYLVVATTRPETMLGDVAVAVHPEDERYQALIGQSVILPLVNRAIPIIADPHADKDKGTGCVKITPAHDFNDYEVGKRHQLPLINIFSLSATVRHTAEIIDPKTQTVRDAEQPLPAELQGMERFAARKWIVAYFEAQGLLETIKPHDLVIPYSERGGVVVEPMLTDQWYVKVAPLAEPAIAAVEQGQIEFIPKQYENMYFSWMRDVQDWCISRQLWWGHRIPAWFDPEGNVYVGDNEQAVRAEAGLSDDIPLKQDEDVLDTWFSSALWTFSTLGWPEQTDALKTFHPTNLLVTGFDIIFFWVARMIMMTMHFVKDESGRPQVPFKQVYITGLIRDEEGQKMSKSKGNVIDPLDMIDGVDLASLLEKRTSNMMLPQLADKIRKRTEKSFPSGIEAHGTDALRFTLTALASSGRDINWDMKRLEGYRNFCNKLWNASRFVLMHTEQQPLPTPEQSGDLAYSLADRWIKAQFNHTVQEFRQALDHYRFDLAANTLYDFIWNQFCDWYLELVKPVLNGEDSVALLATRYTLVTLLEQLLRLAHPVIPFITETIWQRVKAVLQIDADTIMLQAMPKAELTAQDPSAVAQMEWLQQLIVAIRTLRAEMNIAPSKPLQLLVVCDNAAKRQTLSENYHTLTAIARLSSIDIVTKQDELPLSVTKLIDEAELLVPMAGFIDKQAELARLQKEIDKLQQEMARIDTKLSNQSFVAKAPAALIQKEQEKRQNYQADKLKLETQQQNIAQLS